MLALFWKIFAVKLPTELGYFIGQAPLAGRNIRSTFWKKIEPNTRVGTRFDDVPAATLLLRRLLAHAGAPQQGHWSSGGISPGGSRFEISAQRSDTILSESSHFNSSTRANCRGVSLRFPNLRSSNSFPSCGVNIMPLRRSTPDRGEYQQ